MISSDRLLESDEIGKIKKSLAELQEQIAQGLNNERLSIISTSVQMSVHKLASVNQELLVQTLTPPSSNKFFQHTLTQGPPPLSLKKITSAAQAAKD